MMLSVIGFLFSTQASIDSLKLADGFNISVYASDVVNARQIALGDIGTVFVGSRNAGNVYALVDKEKDTAWGRPVDVLEIPEGSLLISDDYADIMYRVSYRPTQNTKKII